MNASKVLKFTGFTLLRIALIILVLFLTMYLWNSLIPQLFHGPVISFWQTAGLIILSKIIFSGVVPIGGRSRRHHTWGHGKFHNEEHRNREEWWKQFHETKGHGNFRNEEHPNREEWLKRVHDTKKDEDSSSTAV